MKIRQAMWLDSAAISGSLDHQITADSRPRRTLELGELRLEDFCFGSATDFTQRVRRRIKIFGEIFTAGGLPAHFRNHGLERVRVRQPQAIVLTVACAFEFQRHERVWSGFFCRATDSAHAQDGNSQHR